MTEPAPRLRGELGAAFARALAAVDLEARVRRAMPRVPPRVRSAAVVAIGKAAPAMARGALAVAADRFAHVLVVAPDGVDARFEGASVEVLRAAHPHPDRRSVVAARRALDVVAGSDFVLALVSGGASSLVCLPQGLSLPRYVRVTRGLLLAGATVRDVNVVRRHLCAVKGGGLARAAGGPVWTLVASDVIGGAAHDVGSGPTVPDPTTRASAAAVVRRFAPSSAGVAPFHESLKPGAALARRLHARLVARPEDLARAMALELEARFAIVRVLPPTVAPVVAVVEEYVARARRLRPGEALVRAAEPAVDVGPAGREKRAGRGGRCTHLAALVAASLPPGVFFLAGASDGVDGSSGTGGAVVDASLTQAATAGALARAVEAFDTGPLLAAAGMALQERPTGTNLTDLHVLARSPGGT
jgi:glycerate 2-kinase